MLSTNDHGLLVGATVAWAGRDGRQIAGEVTSYRQKDGRLCLQVKLPNDGHVWLFADVLDENDQGTFCVLRHGPESVEWGLKLAEAILHGTGARIPISAQMTSLAATCLALECQLEALTGAGPRLQEVAQ